MIKITGYDKPMQVLYMAEGGPDGSYHLRPICPRCTNVLFGDESVAHFVTRNLYGGKKMSKYTRYMANLFSCLYDRFHYEKGVSKFLLSNFRCEAVANSGNDYYLEMCERVLCRIKENIDVLDRNGCCPIDIAKDFDVSDALQNIAVYSGIIMFLKDRYNIERMDNSERVKQYIANDEECETEGENND